MKLPDYQKRVRQFVDAHDLEAPVPARALDLVSEVGEIAKEVLGGSDYGRVPFHPTDQWAGELGDVFFSLICVANSTGINLESALNEALNKYKRRFALKGNLGSGD